MIDCNLKQNINKNECKKKVGEAVFSIIIPKADNSGNKIKVSTIKNHIKKINKRFGGSTTKPVTLGCWNDEERGKLQCETGLEVSTFRDFDTPYDPTLRKLNSRERKEMLAKDFNYMKDVANDIAEEFGQDAVPVIYDNVSDIAFVKGPWRKKMDSSKLAGRKIAGDPFDKNI